LAGAVTSALGNNPARQPLSLTAWRLDDSTMIRRRTPHPIYQACRYHPPTCRGGNLRIARSTILLRTPNKSGKEGTDKASGEYRKKRTASAHSQESVSISQTLFQNPYHASTSQDDTPMAQVKHHAQVTHF